MRAEPVAIIGAGVAGLVSAIDLASKGLDVVVLERAPAPGGKLREVEVGGQRIDAGPTVFTMRWVFERVFEDAGASFSDALKLTPVEVLARHAWNDRDRLDLFPSIKQSADAIGHFAGPAEARRYEAFCERARQIYETLEPSFIASSKPSLPSLVRQAGQRSISDLMSIDPFTSLWRALGNYFHDPRLRQLFGRYATYSGSSPFKAPSLLMLIAHVERQGVWLVDGGMHAIAKALAALATARGARIRYGAHVSEMLTSGGRVSSLKLDSGEQFGVSGVVFNADVSALAQGLFGRRPSSSVSAVSRPARSLSAITWQMLAETRGFPLLRHTVFFSNDYTREFDDLSRDRLPAAPSIYVCAQDRGGSDGPSPNGAERLFIAVNAPALGDVRAFSSSEIRQCEEATFRKLNACGLEVTHRPQMMRLTTPVDFERMFPATGGALYGRASHGWTASFQRPGARSRIPNLYLAGGSVHPGAGVPMAALSGRMAAASLVSDLALIRR